MEPPVVLTPPRLRAAWPCLLAGLLAWPAGAWAQQQLSPVRNRFQQGANNPFTTGVSGEGTIVPAGGLLRIAAPAGAGPAMVGKLDVQVGDWVEAGQMLAELQTLPVYEAQLGVAQRQRDAAAAALGQVSAAGAQAVAEAEGQLADLAGRAAAADAAARLAAVTSRLALDQAKREEALAEAAYASAEQLQPIVKANGVAGVAVAQAQLEASSRLSDEHKVLLAQVEQAKQGQQRADVEMAEQVDQAEAQVEIAGLHVRQAEAALVSATPPDDPTQLAPVQIQAQAAQAALDAEQRALEALKTGTAANVAATQAKLTAAEADVAAAQAQLALGEVRAPSAGRILGVNAHPGEAVGSGGIFLLADTRQMDVQVEIDYEDILYVHLGYHAVIASNAFNDELTGKVVEISPLVGGNVLQNMDPTKFSDKRVVLVKVQLDKPEEVENLVGGQVTVRLEP